MWEHRILPGTYISTCLPNLKCLMKGTLKQVETQHHLEKKVKVTQSCPTLWEPHGLYRGSSNPGIRTQVSHVAGKFLSSWATREVHHLKSKIKIFAKDKSHKVLLSKMYKESLRLRSKKTKNLKWANDLNRQLIKEDT